MIKVWGRLWEGLAKHLKRRVTSGILIGGSIVLLWWSMSYRLPLVNQEGTRLQKMFALESQVIRLRQQWSEDAAVAVRAAAKRAEGRILNGDDELAAWLKEVQDWAHESGLGVAYTIGEATSLSDALGGIKTLPVHIQVTTKEEERSYQAFLQFLRGAVESKNRVDIRKVTITGEGKAADNMGIDFRIWMRGGA